MRPIGFLPLFQSTLNYFCLSIFELLVHLSSKHVIYNADAVMSKRSRTDGHDHRPSKRPKHDAAAKPSPVEEIQFARQIKHLLAFQQDGIPQLRHGIASFKAFLDSILYHKNDDDRARQLSILREYLDSEKPVDIKDSERPFFCQLWQAWSFANQNNNDYLASSIAAIFALLLKVLSSLLDFREHGLLLGRTVLQHRHLRLIKWCLNAPKQKDFLISPCLRLLIEVTSFDGGVLAREAYDHREETFDVGLLKRNLGLLKPESVANSTPMPVSRYAELTVNAVSLKKNSRKNRPYAHGQCATFSLISSTFTRVERSIY